MKLTRRQETFMRSLLDLSREIEGPIHYSVLAERVGVSRITAYDMLRLLEEKGLVRSEYQRSGGKSAPGRAEIVFLPTEFARQRIAQFKQDIDPEDWEATKDTMLHEMQEGIVPDDFDPDFAAQILARVPPEGPASLRYCAEVITVLSLRLREGEGRRLLRDYMPTILSEGERVSAIDLNLLSGFALGMLVFENAESKEWNCELLQHVKQCHNLIAGMSPARRHDLVTSLHEVMRRLNVANSRGVNHKTNDENKDV